jgi:hypothetical protein
MVGGRDGTHKPTPLRAASPDRGGQGVFVAIWKGAGFRILRISTIWMSDHPQPQLGEVRAGLERRSIADRLKQHEQVTVHDSGATTEP